MTNNKPVYIIHDGASKNTMNAVNAGIIELLLMANAPRVKVHDIGFWTQPEYEINGELLPYSSVLWYLQQGDVNNSSQLDVERILDAFRAEPWQTANPHFDVLVTGFDLCAADCNFCIGAALPGIGAVISTARWEGFSERDQFQLIKAETMHEVGHVFGLPNFNRTDLVQSLGGHCQNICIMRQGNLVPTDWVNYTNQAIESGRPFCPACERDLRN